MDTYVSKGILARGLILTCPTCRHRAWYAIGMVTESFACERCRATVMLLAGCWEKDVPEPRWYYEMAEVAYQAFRNDCQYPVMALHRLSQGAYSFSFCPELAVLKGARPAGELDICVVRDSEVILGEAKKNDRLDDSKQGEDKIVRTLRRLAQAATADRVVFATGAVAWRPQTRAAIDSGFRRSGLKVDFLENVATPRPP